MVLADPQAKGEQNGEAVSGSQVKPVFIVEQTGLGSQGYANAAYQSDTTLDSKASQNGDVPEQADSGEDLDEVEKERQEKRDRKPLFYCKMITEHPKKAFGFTLAGQVFFFLITLVLMRVGYDIIPIKFDRIPLSLTKDSDYLRGLAWDGRNDDTDVITRGAEEADDVQAERTVFYDAVDMLFEQQGGNVFTKENLKTIQDVENDFFDDTQYQEKYCLVDDSNTCTKPASVIRYFDGSMTATDATFNDPNFDNIAQVLYTAYTNPATARKFRSYLGATSNITSTLAVSEITTSQIFVGLPLAGFDNNTDRETEQTDDIKQFMLDSYLKKGESYFKNGAGAMDFVYNSFTLIFVIITQQVFLDMALAIGSLGFIIFFICFQTGSLWVGLFAVMSIVTSFFGANLIYRLIFDYRYFGIFHVLALFIILGIGADDVFVFFDTWKQTAHHEYKSLAHRLSDCYRKASLAMLFTSLTTFIAFVVSATSPFLGIYSFGLFAALLVLVNYISVVVFFPTVVVTYHLYWEKYKCCCCCTKPVTIDIAENANAASSKPGNHQRKNIFVRFFRGPYYTLITHKIGKWCIMALFAAFIAVFIFYASKLEVNEEQVKFLKDSSNTGRYLDRRTNAFSKEGDVERTQVLLVWGLKEQDLSPCHHTDPECTGDTVWDESFNLDSETAQQNLLDLCSKLKNRTADLENLKIQRDLLTLEPEILCFVDDMQSFYQTEQDVMVRGVRRYPVSTDLSLPISSTGTDAIRTENPDIYTQPLSNDYHRTFEIAVSYWMYSGFEAGQWSRFEEFNKLVGEAPLSPYTETVITPSSRTAIPITYKYGTRLRYAAILVNTSIEARSQGYPTGLPIRKNWEEFMQAELATMEPVLQGGFQTTPPIEGFDLWHWLKIQKTLVWNALLGVLVGVCCAFPILVFATHNIVTGSIATLTILLIIVCVIGVIPMTGWKLGLLESLNLVLVVGLSVDYVVHLAEGYSRSAHKDRKGRVHDMLEEVGISVLSGAVTTLGASMFLLFAQILFFTQFGLFMFSTIGLSILFALGFFATAMAIMGPQNEFGSLRPIYRAIAKRCCKKSNPE